MFVSLLCLILKRHERFLGDACELVDSLENTGFRSDDAFFFGFGKHSKNMLLS